MYVIIIIFLSVLSLNPSLSLFLSIFIPSILYLLSDPVYIPPTCYSSELRDDNQVLHEENTTLKEYVERLLSTIMIHKPELLEIANQKQQK